MPRHLGYEEQECESLLPICTVSLNLDFLNLALDDE